MPNLRSLEDTNMSKTGGRIDRMIADFEKLQREAAEVIDVYVENVRGTSPFGVVRQIEVTNRAGATLNDPAALRLVKDRIDSMRRYGCMSHQSVVGRRYPGLFYRELIMTEAPMPCSGRDPCRARAASGEEHGAPCPGSTTGT